jgi:hypothetical protein
MSNFSKIGEGKFSNIGERINPDTKSLNIENDNTLTSDELDELFNNEHVITMVSTLSIINCSISTIPESIINLQPNLRELYLNYNNISELPSNLGEMNLLELYLTGNPVTVNEDNLDILYKIYNKTISNSKRKNKARPRIFFDNEDRRESYLVAKKMKNKSISVIGNLDLVKSNGKDRRINKHVLLNEDFVKLYSQIGEPVPIAASLLPEIQPKTTSLRKTKQNKKARNTKVSSSSSSGYEPSSSESSASSSSSSSSRKNKRSTKKKSPSK